MTAAHLAIQEQHGPDGVTLVLAGEIDIATVSDLRAAAERLLKAPPARVILDFAAVTFCDSQGLSTLIALNREIAAAGSRLALARVGDFMARLLDITGLRAAFEIEDTAH